VSNLWYVFIAVTTALLGYIALDGFTDGWNERRNETRNERTMIVQTVPMGENNKLMHCVIVPGSGVTCDWTGFRDAN
jgi:hypothetical protein